MENVQSLTIADEARVRLSEDYELRVWARTFGVTICEVRDAVKTVGDSAEAVGRHLNS